MGTPQSGHHRKKRWKNPAIIDFTRSSSRCYYYYCLCVVEFFFLFSLSDFCAKSTLSLFFFASSFSEPSSPKPLSSLLLFIVARDCRSISSCIFCCAENPSFKASHTGAQSPHPPAAFALLGKKPPCAKKAQLAYATVIKVLLLLPFCFVETFFSPPPPPPPPRSTTTSTFCPPLFFLPPPPPKSMMISFAYGPRRFNDDGCFVFSHRPMPMTSLGGHIARDDTRSARIVALW